MRPSTLPQYLLARATETPRQIAQRHKRKGIWRSYTWSDILEIVLSLAAGLQAKGLRKDEALVIVGDNEPYQVWAALAGQMLGCRTVALFPDVTADELEYTCHDAGARTIIAQDQEQVDKALVFKDQGLVNCLIYWDQSGLWSYSQRNLFRITDVEQEGRALIATDRESLIAVAKAARSDEIACLSYTSGTTGRPKGVICTHGYLLDVAHRIQSALQLRPGDDYVSYTPFAWALEQYMAMALGLSLPLVVNFAERPDQIPEAVREIAPHCLLYGAKQWESWASEVHRRMLDAPRWQQSMVNRAIAIAQNLEDRRRERAGYASRRDQLLRWLLDLAVLRGIRNHFGLNRIRTAVMGGSAMAPDAFRFYHALGVPLRNMYGCSEFGIVTSQMSASVRVGTVGSLIPVDPQFGAKLEARIEPTGELVVRGGSGFAGYWRQPEKTAERQIDGWFRTGDCLSEIDGEYVYIDRLDDMRQLASGKKYSPQFLEVRLRFSPFIKDVLVVGDPTRDSVTALVNIDGHVVGRWAEAQKIAFGGFTDLSQRVEVVSLVRQEISRVNSVLPRHARIVRFANFPKELDPDDGELTRTRKLRRENIERRYGNLIEKLYSADSRCDLEIQIAFQDGRRGMLKADVALTEVE